MGLKNDKCVCVCARETERERQRESTHWFNTVNNFIL